MTLDQINALTTPVVSLTGAEKDLVIGQMFADKTKAARFGAMFPSVTGTWDPERKVRNWVLNAGFPNPGGQEWKFTQPAEASSAIESERDDTASLGNARE